MGGEIKRIDFIKNMAVFRDFQWTSSVKDNGNNVVDFKKINIIYGRNYSGKTTLSRIFRAFETGCISDKYTKPEFQLSFVDGTSLSQMNLSGHGHIIRVFNEDFVKENLRFIIDNEETINSFAILGEDNTKLEEEITKLEEELGSEEDSTGLIGKWLEAQKKYKDAKKSYDDKVKELENKLRDKANKAETGIKYDKAFGDPTYNVTKIKADIETVTADTYNPITAEGASEYYKLLKEEPKKEIEELPPFHLQYSTIAEKAKELIEKKIQPSEPIQELLNDATLAAWVREGRGYHEGKRSTCAFCGNDLPADLWEKLDKHFNQESEELRKTIDGLLTSIDTEIKKIQNLPTIDTSGFYTKFVQKVEEIKKEFDEQTKAYMDALKSIKQQLQNRKDDIFNPLAFDKPKFDKEKLSAIQNSYEEVRQQSNEFTKQLSEEQQKARKVLRLYEVNKFITDIKYSDEQEAIKTLKEAAIEANKEVSTAKEDVDSQNARIGELKAKLKDETKGAERVNDYLNNFFGHQSLSLNAVEETTDGTSSGYKFEVRRDGNKAYHLSEGEASLIAFCYFMAKLEDVETKGKQPIIWIDDPISSLDSNHIFFIYSLINAEIVTNGKFEQLFVSTHNLDFLKYLKRLNGNFIDAYGKQKNYQKGYFVVIRKIDTSTIIVMPKYLKEYVTEFNYLFEQIYKCATVEIVDDTNYSIFYNFENNARKFFEIYLYYKFPNQGMTLETLQSFFGEEKTPAILIDRINNEYSHLAGFFERGSIPVVIPEMQTAAKQILHRLEEADKYQYDALLKSIGVEEALSTNSSEFDQGSR